MSKVLFTLGAAGVGTFALMSRMITALKGSFKPYLVSTLVYLLVALLIFSLIACKINFPLFKDPNAFFIFFQICFLLLGTVHLHFMNKKLEWSCEEKSFLQQLLFTITLTVFGCICFLLIFRFFNPGEWQYLMAASICFFIVPFFVFHTFLSAIAIPLKRLKLWYLPDSEEELDPREMIDVILVSFEIEKQPGDRYYSNIPATVPSAMKFEKLFYYFIKQCNEQPKKGKIQLTDEYGEPQGWMFFKKRKWYSLKTQYIDPEQAIYSNKIKRNDIIVCKRLTQINT